MTTREEREKAISQLEELREVHLNIDVSKLADIVKCLDFAIASIKTDLAYDLDYEGSNGQQEKDISLTFSEGTLKYSCKDYVVYKKDWLRKHFDDERAIECGEQPGQQGWIPIDERPPEVDEDGFSEYVLISCSNLSFPTIGLYYQEADGSGAFYDGDKRTLASCGFMVNAWMPLPKKYSEGEEE